MEAPFAFTKAISTNDALFTKRASAAPSVAPLTVLDVVALKCLQRQMEPLGFYEVHSNQKTFIFVDCRAVSIQYFHF